MEFNFWPMYINGQLPPEFFSGMQAALKGLVPELEKSANRLEDIIEDVANRTKALETANYDTVKRIEQRIAVQEQTHG